MKRRTFISHFAGAGAGLLVVPPFFRSLEQDLHIIELCRENRIPVVERNLSITEFYIADEVFTTGTMGELTRVEEIDGRRIVNRSGETVLRQLETHFRKRTETEGATLPF